MSDDAVHVAPDHYRVLFENDRVRVLKFHAGPGETWGLHSHPDSVVVSLNDYVVQNVVPGSRSTQRQAKHGDVLWIPATRHSGENAGLTEMDCVLVELKDQR